MCPGLLKPKALNPSEIFWHVLKLISTPQLSKNLSQKSSFTKSGPLSEKSYKLLKLKYCSALSPVKNS